MATKERASFDKPGKKYIAKHYRIQLNIQTPGRAYMVSVLIHSFTIRASDNGNEGNYTFGAE